ncbi:MAG: phosphoribosylamine--glycine ligase, partial [Verrucomicrobiaceae bacterium]
LEPGLISFDEGWSVCVVLASAGYPESSRNGDVIAGLDAVDSARIYHAGTKRNGKGEWETNGGRILALVARGETRAEAVTNAHAATDLVSFNGMQRRRDIGICNFED